MKIFAVDDEELFINYFDWTVAKRFAIIGKSVLN